MSVLTELTAEESSLLQDRADGESDYDHVSLTNRDYDLLDDDDGSQDAGENQNDGPSGDAAGEWQTDDTLELGLGEEDRFREEEEEENIDERRTEPEEPKQKEKPPTEASSSSSSSSTRSSPTRSSRSANQAQARMKKNRNSGSSGASRFESSRFWKQKKVAVSKPRPKPPTTVTITPTQQPGAMFTPRHFGSPLNDRVPPPLPSYCPPPPPPPPPPPASPAIRHALPVRTVPRPGRPQPKLPFSRARAPTPPAPEYLPVDPNGPVRKDLTPYTPIDGDDDDDEIECLGGSVGTAVIDRQAPPSLKGYDEYADRYERATASKGPLDGFGRGHNAISTTASSLHPATAETSSSFHSRPGAPASNSTPLEDDEVTCIDDEEPVTLQPSTAVPSLAVREVAVEPKQEEIEFAYNRVTEDEVMCLDAEEVELTQQQQQQQIQQPSSSASAPSESAPVVPKAEEQDFAYNDVTEDEVLCLEPRPISAEQQPSEPIDEATLSGLPLRDSPATEEDDDEMSVEVVDLLDSDDDESMDSGGGADLGEVDSKSNVFGGWSNAKDEDDDIVEIVFQVEAPCKEKLAPTDSTGTLLNARFQRQQHERRQTVLNAPTSIPSAPFRGSIHKAKFRRARRRLESGKLRYVLERLQARAADLTGARPLEPESAPPLTLTGGRRVAAKVVLRNIPTDVWDENAVKQMALAYGLLRLYVFDKEKAKAVMVFTKAEAAADFREGFHNRVEAGRTMTAELGNAALYFMQKKSAALRESAEQQHG